jgi:hypothetical protein
MVNATPDIPPEIGEAIMALHQIAARKRTTMTLMAKAEQLRQDVMAWAALAGVDVRLLDLPGPMQ